MMRRLILVVVTMLVCIALLTVVQASETESSKDSENEEENNNSENKIDNNDDSEIDNNDDSEIDSARNIGGLSFYNLFENVPLLEKQFARARSAHKKSKEGKKEKAGAKRHDGDDVKDKVFKELDELNDKANTLKKLQKKKQNSLSVLAAGGSPPTGTGINMNSQSTTNIDLATQQALLQQSLQQQSPQAGGMMGGLPAADAGGMMAQQPLGAAAAPGAGVEGASNVILGPGGQPLYTQEANAQEVSIPDPGPVAQSNNPYAQLAPNFNAPPPMPIMPGTPLYDVLTKQMTRNTKGNSKNKGNNGKYYNGNKINYNDDNNSNNGNNNNNNGNKNNGNNRSNKNDKGAKSAERRFLLAAKRRFLDAAKRRFVYSLMADAPSPPGSSDVQAVPIVAYPVMGDVVIAHNQQYVGEVATPRREDVDDRMGFVNEDEEDEDTKGDVEQESEDDTVQGFSTGDDQNEDNANVDNEEDNQEEEGEDEEEDEEEDVDSEEKAPSDDSKNTKGIINIEFKTTDDNDDDNDDSSGENGSGLQGRNVLKIEVEEGDKRAKVRSNKQQQNGNKQQQNSNKQQSSNQQYEKSLHTIVTTDDEETSGSAEDIFTTSASSGFDDGSTPTGDSATDSKDPFTIAMKHKFDDTISSEGDITIGYNSNEQNTQQSNMENNSNYNADDNNNKNYNGDNNNNNNYNGENGNNNYNGDNSNNNFNGDNGENNNNYNSEDSNNNYNGDNNANNNYNGDNGNNNLNSDNSNNYYQDNSNDNNVNQSPDNNNNIEENNSNYNGENNINDNMDDTNSNYQGDNGNNSPNLEDSSSQQNSNDENNNNNEANNENQSNEQINNNESDQNNQDNNNNNNDNNNQNNNNNNQNNIQNNENQNNNQNMNFNDQNFENNNQNIQSNNNSNQNSQNNNKNNVQNPENNNQQNSANNNNNNNNNQNNNNNNQNNNEQFQESNEDELDKEEVMSKGDLTNDDNGKSLTPSDQSVVICEEDVEDVPCKRVEKGKHEKKKSQKKAGKLRKSKTAAVKKKPLRNGKLSFQEPVFSSPQYNVPSNKYQSSNTTPLPFQPTFPKIASMMTTNAQPALDVPNEKASGPSPDGLATDQTMATKEPDDNDDDGSGVTVKPVDLEPASGDGSALFHPEQYQKDVSFDVNIKTGSTPLAPNSQFNVKIGHNIKPIVLQSNDLNHPVPWPVDVHEFPVHQEEEPWVYDHEPYFAPHDAPYHVPYPHPSLINPLSRYPFYMPEHYLPPVYPAAGLPAAAAALPGVLAALPGLPAVQSNPVVVNPSAAPVVHNISDALEPVVNVTKPVLPAPTVFEDEGSGVVMAPGVLPDATVPVGGIPGVAAPAVAGGLPVNTAGVPLGAVANPLGAAAVNGLSVNNAGLVAGTRLPIANAGVNTAGLPLNAAGLPPNTAATVNAAGLNTAGVPVTTAGLATNAAIPGVATTVNGALPAVNSLPAANTVTGLPATGVETANEAVVPVNTAVNEVGDPTLSNANLPADIKPSTSLANNQEVVPVEPTNVIQPVNTGLKTVKIAGKTVTGNTVPADGIINTVPENNVVATKVAKNTTVADVALAGNVGAATSVLLNGTKVAPNNLVQTNNGQLITKNALLDEQIINEAAQAPSIVGVHPIQEALLNSAGNTVIPTTNNIAALQNPLAVQNTGAVLPNAGSTLQNSVLANNINGVNQPIVAAQQQPTAPVVSSQTKPLSNHVVSAKQKKKFKSKIKVSSKNLKIKDKAGHKKQQHNLASIGDDDMVKGVNNVFTMTASQSDTNHKEPAHVSLTADRVANHNVEEAAEESISEDEDQKNHQKLEKDLSDSKLTHNYVDVQLAALNKRIDSLHKSILGNQKLASGGAVLNEYFNKSNVFSPGKQVVAMKSSSNEEITSGEGSGSGEIEVEEFSGSGSAVQKAEIHPAPVLPLSRRPLTQLEFLDYEMSKDSKEKKVKAAREPNHQLDSAGEVEASGNNDINQKFTKKKVKSKEGFKVIHKAKKTEDPIGPEDTVIVPDNKSGSIEETLDENSSDKFDKSSSDDSKQYNTVDNKDQSIGSSNDKNKKFSKAKSKKGVKLTQEGKNIDGPIGPEDTDILPDKDSDKFDNTGSDDSKNNAAKGQDNVKTDAAEKNQDNIEKAEVSKEGPISPEDTPSNMDEYQLYEKRVNEIDEEGSTGIEEFFHHQRQNVAEKEDTLEETSGFGDSESNDFKVYVNESRAEGSGSEQNFYASNINKVPLDPSAKVSSSGNHSKSFTSSEKKKMTEQKDTGLKKKIKAKENSAGDDENSGAELSEYDFNGNQLDEDLEPPGSDGSIAKNSTKIDSKGNFDVEDEDMDEVFDINLTNKDISAQNAHNNNTNKKRPLQESLTSVGKGEQQSGKKTSKLVENNLNSGRFSKQLSGAKREKSFILTTARKLHVESSPWKVAFGGSSSAREVSSADYFTKESQTDTASGETIHFESSGEETLRVLHHDTNRSSIAVEEISGDIDNMKNSLDVEDEVEESGAFSGAASGNQVITEGRKGKTKLFLSKSGNETKFLVNDTNQDAINTETNNATSRHEISLIDQQEFEFESHKKNRTHHYVVKGEDANGIDDFHFKKSMTVGELEDSIEGSGSLNIQRKEAGETRKVAQKLQSSESREKIAKDERKGGGKWYKKNHTSEAEMQEKYGKYESIKTKAKTKDSVQGKEKGLRYILDQEKEKPSENDYPDEKDSDEFKKSTKSELDSKHHITVSEFDELVDESNTTSVYGTKEAKEQSELKDEEMKNLKEENQTRIELQTDINQKGNSKLGNENSEESETESEDDEAEDNDDEWYKMDAEKEREDSDENAEIYDENFSDSDTFGGGKDRQESKKNDNDKSDSKTSKDKNDSDADDSEMKNKASKSAKIKDKGSEKQKEKDAKDSKATKIDEGSGDDVENSGSKEPDEGYGENPFNEADKTDEEIDEEAEDVDESKTAKDDKNGSSESDDIKNRLKVAEQKQPNKIPESYRNNFTVIVMPKNEKQGKNGTNSKPAKQQWPFKIMTGKDDGKPNKTKDLETGHSEENRPTGESEKEDKDKENGESSKDESTKESKNKGEENGDSEDENTEGDSDDDQETEEEDSKDTKNKSKDDSDKEESDDGTKEESDLGQSKFKDKEQKSVKEKGNSNNDKNKERQEPETSKDVEDEEGENNEVDDSSKESGGNVDTSNEKDTKESKENDNESVEEAKHADKDEEKNDGNKEKEKETEKIEDNDDNDEDEGSEEEKDGEEDKKEETNHADKDEEEKNKDQEKKVTGKDDEGGDKISKSQEEDEEGDEVNDKKGEKEVDDEDKKDEKNEGKRKKANGKDEDNTNGDEERQEKEGEDKEKETENAKGNNASKEKKEEDNEEEHTKHVKEEGDKEESTDVEEKDDEDNDSKTENEESKNKESDKKNNGEKNKEGKKVEKLKSKQETVDEKKGSKNKEKSTEDSAKKKEEKKKETEENKTQVKYGNEKLKTVKVKKDKKKNETILTTSQQNKLKPTDVKKNKKKDKKTNDSDNKKGKEDKKVKQTLKTVQAKKNDHNKYKDPRKDQEKERKNKTKNEDKGKKVKDNSSEKTKKENKYEEKKKEKLEKETKNKSKKESSKSKNKQKSVKVKTNKQEKTKKASKEERQDENLGKLMLEKSKEKKKTKSKTKNNESIEVLTMKQNKVSPPSNKLSHKLSVGVLKHKDKELLDVEGFKGKKDANTKNIKAGRSSKEVSSTKKLPGVKKLDEPKEHKKPIVIFPVSLKKSKVSSRKKVTTAHHARAGASKKKESIEKPTKHKDEQRVMKNAFADSVIAERKSVIAGSKSYKLQSNTNLQKNVESRKNFNSARKTSPKAPATKGMQVDKKQNLSKSKISKKNSKAKGKTKSTKRVTEKQNTVKSGKVSHIKTKKQSQVKQNPLKQNKNIESNTHNVKTVKNKKNLKKAKESRRKLAQKLLKNMKNKKTGKHQKEKKVKDIWKNRQREKEKERQNQARKVRRIQQHKLRAILLQRQRNVFKHQALRRRYAIEIHRLQRLRLQQKSLEKRHKLQEAAFKRSQKSPRVYFTNKRRNDIKSDERKQNNARKGDIKIHKDITKGGKKANKRRVRRGINTDPDPDAYLRNAMTVLQNETLRLNKNVRLFEDRNHKSVFETSKKVANNTQHSNGKNLHANGVQRDVKKMTSTNSDAKSFDALSKTAELLTKKNLPSADLPSVLLQRLDNEADKLTTWADNVLKTKEEIENARSNTTHAPNPKDAHGLSVTKQMPRKDNAGKTVITGLEI